MRVTVNVDCTPEEARAFLGLPDVSKLNAVLVDRVASQAETNLDLVDPSELIKAWTSFGGAMRDQLLGAMLAGVSAAAAPGADEPKPGKRGK